MGIIEIKGLSFSYPEKTEQTLHEVNLSVEEGEFVVLCGVSGCGKSTLLRQLKPALTPFGRQTGQIRYDGKRLQEHSDRTLASEIGYVLQNPEQQIVTEKVWHELAFGLESLGEEQQTIRLRVAEMSAYFGIEPIYHKQTDALSGGQKQLLNLASVMAMNPRVLLLDEPTSQLDPIIAANFLSTVKKINQELGITVILTEHRLGELFGMADRIALMDQGTIAVCGTPQEIAGWIAAKSHVMYGALPAPAQIYHELQGTGGCPLNVRDGRAWFRNYAQAQHMPEKSDRKLKERRTHQTDRRTGDRQSRQEELLECREVWFRYEKNAPDILKDLTLSVRKGELYCLLGGNGAGKSTALSVLCGLYQPYRGKVFLKGKPLTRYRSGELYHGLLGVVPQNPQCLFVKNTVEQELQEMTAEQEAVQEIAVRLQLETLLQQHPYDLSGGEQQRLAIAKILLLGPEILLMDEPTKGLDCQRKKELADIMTELKAEGITIVIVSHDIEFCAQYGDTCGMLFDGGLALQAPAKHFFAGNSFYTTAANRMVRRILPEAVTTDDVVKRCRTDNESASELPHEEKGRHT